LSLRRSSKRLRIICNLQSAGCNPYAIENLLTLGAQVRTNPRLHAKIYAAGRIVIIGSSNASRYGITSTGEVIRGSLEANIITDDKSVVTESRDFFEEVWNSTETSKITKTLLARAKEVWRPVLPPPVPGRSLLGAAADDRALLDRLFVAAYSEPLSRAANERLNEVKRRAVADVDEDSFRNAWGYQFADPVPAGSWVIDLSCKKVTRIHGCARIPDPVLRLRVPGENDLVIAVPEVVSVQGKRLTLSASDKEQLIRVAPKILNARSGTYPMPLARVLRMLS
jgi:hypothetical protein